MSLTDHLADELDVVSDVARCLHLDPGRFSHASVMTAAALVGWDHGRAGDASALLRRAVVCADSEPGSDGTTRALPRLMLATMLTGIGRFAEAETRIRELEVDLALDDDPRMQAIPPIFRSRTYLAAGRLDEAVAAAQSGIDLAAEYGGGGGFVPLARLTLATAALYRDDLRTASAQTANYRSEPPPPRVGVGWSTYAWAAARVLEAREGPLCAFAALRTVYDDLDLHQRLLLEEPAAAGWLARIALQAGEPAHAGEVAAQAMRLANENLEIAGLAGAAAHARGVFERASSPIELAAVQHSQPWARASAAEDAGVVLLACGNTDRAPRLFERALDEYLCAGATRDAARIHARLRDLGIRRGRRQREHRPVAGWESLTTTECRVADLVAEGLTNQQTSARMFLSRHTVDFHLRQIFRKLAISSRVELVRIVLERGRRPERSAQPS